MTGDPLWSDVELLATFDGSFADLSSTDRTPAGSGGATINTTTVKFGAGSLDTTAGSGAGVSYSPPIVIGTAPFTIECWAAVPGTYPNPGVGSTTASVLLAEWTSSYDFFFGFDNHFGNGLVFYTSGSYGYTTYEFPTDSLWHHYCAERDSSNTLRLYIDGVVKGSWTNFTATIGGADTLTIGNVGGGSSAWPGQIDSMRVTVGAARYGGAFTPPTADFPTGPVSGAHRYWRVYVTAQAGGGGGNTSISELSMAASTGGANLCTGSGVSVDSTVVGPATNMFDGNINTFWANNGELPAWVAYDFGEGNAYAIVEVKITPRNDGYYAQAPQTWQLQWSDDGSTWTTRAFFTAGAWTAGSPQTFDAPTPATNRFWRIYVTTVQSGTQLAIAELSMASTPGGANLCTTSADALASSVLNSGYATAYAIDGNPSTEWAPVGGLPAWWAYDFGAGGGPSIREVKITARNDSYVFQAPIDWELQVSEDFETWTTVQSFISATWTAGEQQTFEVPAAGAASAAYMMPVMF